MVKENETMQNIELKKRKPFRNHPFKVEDEGEMKIITESVRSIGVLVPAIARPHGDGSYELITRHRRKHACEQIGLPTIPIIIRDLDIRLKWNLTFHLSDTFRDEESPSQLLESHSFSPIMMEKFLE